MNYDCEGLFRDRHEWSKWQTLEVTRHIVTKQGEHKEYTVSAQRRECTKCGKVQMEPL